MLTPSFELARIIKIQYSFVYTVQMQKRKRTQEKHKHCARKEQIPSFRIAFQTLDECREALNLGFCLTIPGDNLKREW